MAIKNFKILTLGTSGAGKTVFLASMFKRLFTQEDDQFNLKLDNQAQRRKLNAIYTQLLTGEQWPEGTRGYSEWTFTCRVQTEDLSNYTACQFTYFDYAGGRLTDADHEPEFLTMLHQADAILGLLDGHKLYHWLSDRQSAKVTEFLEDDLPRILHCMQQSQAPIQFVISKWDLLEPHFTLETVRDRLLAIPQFQQVVQARCQAGSLVRLIPVSAVGSGFARLENDVMQRIPSAIPMPEFVEVPIACVLPDQLTFQLHKVLAKQREMGQAKPNFVQIAAHVFTVLGTGLDWASGLLASLFNDSLLVFALTEGTASLSNMIGRSMQQSAQERSAQLAASLKQVNDEETALKHAIKSFVQIQQEFLTTYPESQVDRSLADSELVESL